MNLLYLMYMDVWPLPGSGERVAGKRGGRWEMTSVLCLYYRLVQQDHITLKPEPPGKFR